MHHLPFVKDVTVAWYVRLYIRMSSVTMVDPAKALDGMRYHLAGTLIWSVWSGLYAYMGFATE